MVKILPVMSLIALSGSAGGAVTSAQPVINGGDNQLLLRKSARPTRHLQCMMPFAIQPQRERAAGTVNWPNRQWHGERKKSRAKPGDGAGAWCRSILVIRAILAAIVFARPQ
jgi:hypothetical protein